MRTEFAVVRGDTATVRSQSEIVSSRPTEVAARADRRYDLRMRTILTAILVTMAACGGGGEPSGPDAGSQVCAPLTAQNVSTWQHVAGSCSGTLTCDAMTSGVSCPEGNEQVNPNDGSIGCLATKPGGQLLETVWFACP